ncbi:copper amine oxidase N-terminal domain-containing protein [Cohnella nanjingensis]|uniref:Copper amine oxidase N-terminal domain-containing protein n=1 Tax=Cohnella nanjingensis TaxID=1387779 RepID=A0A7X0VJ53_9BACL|nr:copper amine oxidase N-terminal domain-containing protein [Cohnella nanjingensis]MBB6675203.1 copper amine oxidase N-terminal domain-containing protein [Cohnella nanjingensis]
MNKWIKPVVAATLLGGLLSAGSSAFAASGESNQVFIDGRYQDSAITVQGRTLVQLRALDDPAWLTYTYDAKTGIVTATSKDKSKVVKLRAGQKTATVGGASVKLDATIVNKDGRTYVPLRFISESLGAYVTYNTKDKRAIVRTPAGQEKFKTLMSGDLPEARKAAISLQVVQGKDALQPLGEGFSTEYVFPQGKALKYTTEYKGLKTYVEVNADGIAEAKWQTDTYAADGKKPREKGTKPAAFGDSVYFYDNWMGETLMFGKIDAAGKRTELGNYNRIENPEYKNVVIVPIDDESRTDGK